MEGVANVADPANTPGGRTPPPGIQEVAPHFPEPEILEIIGAGGMGVIYKARQPKLDRLVALKVIRADLATEEMLARFQMETAALGRLQHPGIARIYEAGSAMVDGHPQPYLSG